MILTVARKAKKTTAIRFEKGRAAEAKAQLLEQDEIRSVKNGGSYLQLEVEGEEYFVRMHVGDVLVFEPVMGVNLYTAEEFDQLFNIKK